MIIIARKLEVVTSMSEVASSFGDPALSDFYPYMHSFHNIYDMLLTKAECSMFPMYHCTKLLIVQTTLAKLMRMSRGSLCSCCVNQNYFELCGCFWTGHYFIELDDPFVSGWKDNLNIKIPPFKWPSPPDTCFRYDFGACHAKTMPPIYLELVF